MNWQPLVVPALTAVISAVVTYFSARSKIKLDLTAEYDKELRRDRLGVYKVLWAILEPLARYSRKEPLTNRLLKSTSAEMRQWYFETGGIYLSRETRKPYFALKEAMHRLIERNASEGRELDEADPLVKTVLELGTRLRANLADDVGTRQGLFTRYLDLE